MEQPCTHRPVDLFVNIPPIPAHPRSQRRLLGQPGTYQRRWIQPSTPNTCELIRSHTGWSPPAMYCVEVGVSVSGYEDKRLLVVREWPGHWCISFGWTDRRPAHST